MKKICFYLLSCFLISYYSNAQTVAFDKVVSNIGNNKAIEWKASSDFSFKMYNYTYQPGGGDPVYNFRFDGVNTDVGITTNFLTFTSSGVVGIGTTLTGNIPGDFNEYRLFVKQGIRTEKVKVDLSTSGWGDYVFSPNYRLRPLSEVATFIYTNKHLPDVPSEKELKEKGLNLAEMHKTQMVKIEELTLYLIELSKENELLKKRIEELERKFSK